MIKIQNSKTCIIVLLVFGLTLMGIGQTAWAVDITEVGDSFANDAANHYNAPYDIGLNTYSGTIGCFNCAGPWDWLDSIEITLDTGDYFVSAYLHNNSAYVVAPNPESPHIPAFGVAAYSTYNFNSAQLAAWNADRSPIVQLYDAAGAPSHNNSYIFGVTIAEPVPEPATMLLLGSGLVGLAGLRRKKFKK